MHVSKVNPRALAAMRRVCDLGQTFRNDRQLQQFAFCNLTYVLLKQISTRLIVNTSVRFMSSHKDIISMKIANTAKCKAAKTETVDYISNDKDTYMFPSSIITAQTFHLGLLDSRSLMVIPL